MNKTLPKELNKGKDRIYSPEDVRAILDVDNSVIKNLCKKSGVLPKKDSKKGMMFFYEKDVSMLMKVKELQQKSERIIKEKQNPKKAELTNQQATVTTESFSEDMNALISAVNQVNNTITNQVSQVIEEKLEGIDEVVVELVRTKADNERLNLKLDTLTKENYALKMELDSYRELGFGFYKKD